MYSLLLRCALALSLVALAGCGDDGETGGTGGSGGTGGTGGANTTPVSAEITGFDPDVGPTGPVEGVELCETGTDNCATTDAEGSATLQLPVGEEISVTLEKEGYQSYLVAAVVPAEPPVLTLSLATVERIELLHGLVMSPYPMEGTGDLIVVSIVASPFPGITLDLGEATGKAFYYNEEGNWDADLTATTSYGFGPWGGFTEVSPGEVQVELGGTAEGCIALTGWPGDVDNSVRMPIRAGYLTHTFVSCEAP